MDVVKQVFDNYINRTLAYDIPNHIGKSLLLIDDKWAK